MPQVYCQTDTPGIRSFWSSVLFLRAARDGTLDERRVEEMR
jgi:hypothetical protein